MKQHHKVDEQEIIRFNMMRENQAGKTYNLAEFQALLKRMNYATSGNLIKCMVEAGVFIRIERGKYAFSPKPVHISCLQKAWDDYAYMGRNKMSKNQDKQQLELDVRRAIKLLKDLGYKVLRPTTQYEEV